MPKKGPDEGAMIQTAVKLYNSSTIMTVHQCLLGAEFTPKQSDDKARQMKVRRRINKRNKGNGTFGNMEDMDGDRTSIQATTRVWLARHPSYC